MLSGPGTGKEEIRKSIDLGQPDLTLQDDVTGEVSTEGGFLICVTNTVAAEALNIPSAEIV